MKSVAIGPVVSEEKSFEIVDGQRSLPILYAPPAQVS